MKVMTINEMRQMESKIDKWLVDEFEVEMIRKYAAFTYEHYKSFKSAVGNEADARESRKLYKMISERIEELNETNGWERGDSYND